MIRTFIIDDHQLFIDGLKALLKLEKNIEVVGEALSGEDAIVALEQMEVDVLITDYSMDGMTGYEVIKYVRKCFPEIRILTLTMHADISYIDQMTNAGSLGYILKNTGRKELIEAIEAVYAGKTYFTMRVKESILENYTNELPPLPEDTTNNNDAIDFTRREKQVLKLLITGLPSKEIADVMCMSLHTVNTHRKNINSKIGALGYTTLTQYVNRHKIFDD